MNEKIHIEDGSNDRNYFTIIPNYILNHSTANDQALYLQMKRYAGEKGECFASERKLRKQLGIGVVGLKKSIQYLLNHKWIRNSGTKQVMTKGGTQDIQVYVVNDIWKMNSEHYKGVPETAPPKGVPENETRCSPNNEGGVPETATKKNYTKEEPIKKNQALALKNTFTEFDNVKLTEEELQKLETKLGKNETLSLMDELGTYIASTGRKYSSHYATLLSWARRKGTNYKSKKITVI